MTFDVVFGNPPYQDFENKAKRWVLWHAFVQKSCEQLNDNGHMTLITPPSWLGGGEIYELLKSFNLININTQIAHHFSGIGSDFSSFHLIKQEYGQKTNINGFEVDLTNFDFLPKITDQSSISICAKLMLAKNKLLFSRTTEYHTTNKTVDDA